MVKYILLLFLILSFNVAADVDALVDPTKPLSYTVKSVKKKQRIVLPKLQSILIKGKQKQAIIDNKLYIAGQKIKGYQITEIKKDAVLLSYQNKSYKLTLYSAKEHFTD